MGKHARIGKVETEFEKIGKKNDMGFAAVDINPDEKGKKVDVVFQYAGYPSTRYEPGEPSGSETWTFHQDYINRKEDFDMGSIKHKLIGVSWNGEEIPEKDVDPDFKEIVLEEMVPLLDRHFTQELY